MGLRVLITNIGLWPPSGTVAIHARPRPGAAAPGPQPRGVQLDGRRRGRGAARRRHRGHRQAGPAPETPDIIHGHHHAPTLGRPPALADGPGDPRLPRPHVTERQDADPPEHPPPLRRQSGLRPTSDRRRGARETEPSWCSTSSTLARFSPRTALPERSASCPRLQQLRSRRAVICRRSSKHAVRPGSNSTSRVPAWAGSSADPRRCCPVRHRVRQGQGGDGGDGRRNGGHPVRLQRRRADGDVDPIRRVAAAQLRVRGAARSASSRSFSSARSRVTTQTTRHAFATCFAPAPDWSPPSRTSFAIYSEAIAEHGHMPAGPVSRPGRWSIRRSLFLRLYWPSSKVSLENRVRLKKVPGVRVIWRGLGRLIG